MRQKYYKQKEVANGDSKQFDETVVNIVSACPILAKEWYMNRHDRVCAQLHFNKCKEIGAKLDKQRYDDVPKSFETSHEAKITVLWNQQCELTELFLTVNRTS